MSDLKLTPTLVAMLERIEQHSGALLMLAVTASGGGEYGKLNKLRGAGYVVKCDHPSVTEGAWPAEALAITEAGRAALAQYRAELTQKKGRHRHGVASLAQSAKHRPGDKRVVFRRDGERYIVFLDDDRIGFVRRADNGTWNQSIRRWPIPAKSTSTKFGDDAALYTFPGFRNTPKWVEQLKGTFSFPDDLFAQSPCAILAFKKASLFLL